jgi:hypothetical protein
LGKVYQRAVLRCPGIIFPTPYPQGYGATPPLPRPPQSACDVPRSMPEAAADGNAGCVVHRGRPAGDGTRLPAAADTRRRPSGTTESPPHRVTIASRHRTAPGSDAAPAPPPRPTDRARHHRRPVRDRHGRPRGVRPPVRTGRPRGVRHIHRRCTRPHPRPRGSTPPPAAPCSAGPNAWPPTGPRERTGAVARRGRTPVERLNPAQVTVYFQPTSHPCRFLGELADQPPCYQARRDHAVRFHPTGTGH